ncbi:MAG: polyhydroxybutyrate depolymerase [Pseudomonadota bacterium]
MTRTRLLIGIGLVFAGFLPTAWACGPDTDCNIGERTYRIEMPKEPPKGALIYAHGYRGSAKAVMRNKALRALAQENGLALIAPKSFLEDWRIPGVPADPGTDGAQEFTYFDALLDTLKTEHAIPADRIYMSGFSAGGMMVWNLACRMGSRFAGFIPIAGTFWDPVPPKCPDMGAHMVHIHGRTDKIVPLGGRPIGPTRQGDVPQALALFAEGGGESLVKVRAFGELDCRAYTPDNDDRSLSFCTHPGGHYIKMDYLRAAFTILREQGAF